MPQFPTAEPAETILAALVEALDQADFGVALLDRELRPRFLNRKFSEFWADAVMRADLPGWVEQRERGPVVLEAPGGERLKVSCLSGADGGYVLVSQAVAAQPTPDAV